MILKRKINSPIITDSFGIEHPNIIIGFFALPEDKLNKWLEIYCGYYHDLFIYSERKDKNLFDNEINLSSFVMRFTKEGIPSVHNGGTVIKLGHPTYDELKRSIDINSDGTISMIADDVLYWILNQEFYKDHEGKIFAENWEVDTTL